MVSTALLILAAVAFFAIHIVATILKPGVRSIPGPWLAKVTDLYRVGMILRGHFSDELVELHRKYGSAVRLGPDSVSLTDKAVVDDIYGYRTDFGKSDWVKSSQTLYQGKVVPALMTTQDKQYHGALKRSIAGAYSVSTVMGYEKTVEDVVNYFFRRLDELFIRPKATCPLDQWLQWYAYDVIGAITTSRPMGLLEQGTDVDDMLSEIKIEGDYRAVGAVMPLVDWILRKNFLMTFFSSPTHKIMVRARSMLTERLSTKEDASSPRRDFISRFLEAKEKHPETLNDRNMLGFVGSNLQAGSDTTAIALRTIMYHIMKDSTILAKLRAELDDSGLAHPIPFQQASNDLPYLDAVIQEAFRIHPPFALLLERAVPASGLELPSGVFLEQGTRVGMFGYIMHIDKGVFGDDAEVFNPDRWLRRADEDEDDFKERLRRMKSLDMTFGHGQRKCVGVHVAEMQIYKLVPGLVRLLDIEPVHPEREWTVRQRFFSLQSDIDVRVKWRKGYGLEMLADPEDIHNE